MTQHILDIFFGHDNSTPQDQGHAGVKTFEIQNVSTEIGRTTSPVARWGLGDEALWCPRRTRSLSASWTSCFCGSTRGRWPDQCWCTRRRRALQASQPTMYMDIATSLSLYIYIYIYRERERERERERWMDQCGCARRHRACKQVCQLVGA